LPLKINKDDVTITGRSERVRYGNSNAYNFLQALKILKVNYSFVRSFRDFYWLLIEYFSEISSIMMIDKTDCGLI